MLNGFRAFVLCGNVIDLAVAFVVDATPTDDKLLEERRDLLKGQQPSS